MGHAVREQAKEEVSEIALSTLFLGHYLQEAFFEAFKSLSLIFLAHV